MFISEPNTLAEGIKRADCPGLDFSTTPRRKPTPKKKKKITRTEGGQSFSGRKEDWTLSGQ